MPEESQTIRVNFGRPMPIFPLSGVVLLPHAVLPLHIFEPRYRQMVQTALDGPGQIAMAVFEVDNWREKYQGAPPVRPAVCVGQIVQHERLPDGRYNLLLQGVCRALIQKELPADEGRLFRTCLLRPLGLPAPDEKLLTPHRRRLLGLFSEPPLTRLTVAEGVRDVLKAEEAPTSAALELIAISLISDCERKYSLLAEADPQKRAAVIEAELGSLASLIRRADKQVDRSAPKGVSWN